jgi:hypothetical protein
MNSGINMFGDTQQMVPVTSENTPESVMRAFPHLTGATIDSRFAIAECRERSTDAIGICLDGPGDSDDSIAGKLAAQHRDWDGKANVTYNNAIVFQAATEVPESNTKIILACAGAAALVVVGLLCFLTKKEAVVVEAKRRAMFSRK